MMMNYLVRCQMSKINPKLSLIMESPMSDMELLAYCIVVISAGLYVNLLARSKIFAWLGMILWATGISVVIFKIAERVLS